MKTALDYKTYKIKINDIDTITWMPVNTDQNKYGLFKQDKNGNFTINILNKYYHLPPYHKGQFNFLYESLVNETKLIEFSIGDIIQKVKHKLKTYRGEMVSIFKNDDNTYDFVMVNSPKEASNLKKVLHSNIKDVHRLDKNELKLILSYLWPHKGLNNNSEEEDVNKLVDKIAKSKEKTNNVYVDVNALSYLLYHL